MHSDDSVAPVGYLNLKLHLEPKENFDTVKLPPTVKNSIDFINDLSDTVFSDLSDIELSESELESIEKLEKEEKKKQKELHSCSGAGDKTDGSPTVDVIDSQNDSPEGVEERYYFDQSQEEGARPHIADHRCIYGNRHGWYFIGGIVGEGSDTGAATEDAMKKLISR